MEGSRGYVPVYMIRTSFVRASEDISSRIELREREKIRRHVGIERHVDAMLAMNLPMGRTARTARKIVVLFTGVRFVKKN